MPALLLDERLDTPRLTDLRQALGWSWEHMVVAAAAMLGAILLSLPLSIIYLRTKPAHEFDSAVLFSIVILSATIAGILVVVEGSVARALSLAGVVSAVRFRSSLKDSNDAVYLLGAIAVGLAAGSRALDIGLVIAVLLSGTLLVLWKLRLDAMQKALLPAGNHTHNGHPHNHGQDHSADQPAKATTLMPRRAGDSSGPTHEVQPSPRLGYFIIQTEHPERTRLLVEMFLERETKRWRLDGSSGNGNGDGRGHRNANARAHSTLMYLVRFRKNSQPATLLKRIRAVGEPTDFTVQLETEFGVAERTA